MPPKKRDKMPAPKSKTKTSSPYILFSTESRAKVKTEHPNASFGEIAKILGAKWKEMPDCEREMWKKKRQ